MFSIGPSCTRSFTSDVPPALGYLHCFFIQSRKEPSELSRKEINISSSQSSLFDIFIQFILLGFYQTGKV